MNFEVLLKDGPSYQVLLYFGFPRAKFAAEVSLFLIVIKREKFGKTRQSALKMSLSFPSLMRYQTFVDVN